MGFETPDPVPSHLFAVGDPARELGVRRERVHALGYWRA